PQRADQEQHPRLVTRHVTRPTPVCPAETPHSSTFTGRQLRNPGPAASSEDVLACAGTSGRTGVCTNRPLPYPPPTPPHSWRTGRIPLRVGTDRPAHAGRPTERPDPCDDAPNRGDDVQRAPRWRGTTSSPPSDRKSTRLNSSHVKISYAV